MDLACFLQKLLSAAVAQKQGCEASNQLEGFLLNILSSGLFCKASFSSQPVNFGSSDPSNPTHFKLCQSWPQLWTLETQNPEQPTNESSKNWASFKGNTTVIWGKFVKPKLFPKNVFSDRSAFSNDITFCPQIPEQLQSGLRSGSVTAMRSSCSHARQQIQFCKSTFLKLRVSALQRVLPLL